MQASLPEKVMTDADKFLAMLKSADVVTVDDGAYLHDWSMYELTGDPDNQVLRFSWKEGRYEFSSIHTEAGLQAGRFTHDGKFVCNDIEGEATQIRCFNVQAITAPPAIPT